MVQVKFINKTNTVVSNAGTRFNHPRENIAIDVYKKDKKYNKTQIKIREYKTQIRGYKTQLKIIG